MIDEEYLKDRVTIYEVAKASGVSLATVSRVINNKPNVTMMTREKVKKTIERLGYKPSGLAQALATSRSTNIGVIIPSANYVYVSNMLNGITEVAREKGFSLTLFVTSHSREEALKMMERLITSHVDGAIIFDDELDEKDIVTIASYSVPTIVINNKLTSAKVGCIIFGYEHGLRDMLAGKFADDDGKMPIFLHVHNAGRLLARIERCFITCCEKAKKEYRIVNVDDKSYLSTYEQFRDFFEEERRGYFIAYRDSIAAAILNAATDVGLKVPEDVEVVSLIGTKYADIIRPSVTNMHIDMQEVGRRAMYMLSELSDGELKQKIYKEVSVYQKGASTRR